MKVIITAWELKPDSIIDTIIDEAPKGAVCLVIINDDNYSWLTQKEIDRTIESLIVKKEILILVVDCVSTSLIEKIALGFDFCLTTMAENTSKSYINRQIDGQEIEKGVREFMEQVLADKQDSTIEGIVALFKQHKRYKLGLGGNCEEAEEKLFLLLASLKE